MRVTIVGAGAGPALALRRQLAEDGLHRVTTCSRRPLAPLGGETAVLVEEYRDAPLDADVVINFVGEVSGKDPASYALLNVELPLTLATRARRKGGSLFIHLSTLAVYGAALDIGADTPVAPLSMYGASKLEGDTGLLALATPGFAVTVLRAPAIYGPGLEGKLASLARLFRRIGMFPAPTGDSERSTLHVRHLAYAIIDIIGRRQDGVRFAADPWPFSLPALARAISARRGRLVRLLRIPEFVFLPMKLVARQAYQSLYGRSLIQPDQVIVARNRRYLEPSQALGDLLG